jgi:pyruvate/2-oxoglutarate dehydrogenase complex dihydrolipoamide dehydrogenase (E3) component
MNTTVHYNTVIIGFGKAGKTLAAAEAAAGKRVALIEQSAEMYGGTCINVGCIPSKSLVNSAAEAALHKGEPFAARADYYAAAIREKRRVTALLRGKNYHKLADLPNVTVYDGVGSFRAANEVEVAGKDGTLVLTGDDFLINTGSLPVLPPIPGLAGNPKVYTSEQLMDEENLPARLVLIGAGYIGMEFASLYSSFGSDVTVLQDGPVFLPREDRDVADAIRQILESRGVRFVLDVKVTAAEEGTVRYTQGGAEYSLAADAILVAAGRRANTEALHAEKAGVALTPRGAVQVDAQLRTTAPHIWAAGDVAGGLQFTYISLDDFRVVHGQLAGKGTRTTADRKHVPYSVFMEVPLGRVGLTEAEAQAKGIAYRVVKLPTAAVPKAQVLRKTEGFLKALIDPETGRILGAALLCPEAYELINLIALAMDWDLDYTALRDRIYTHPTMTEALNDLFAL